MARIDLRQSFFLLALLAGVVSPVSVLAGWPKFHQAPGMEVNWGADKMVYNGIHLKIETFTCECSSESILDYYRMRWGRLDQGFVETESGPYRQIARSDGKYFFNVQVKDVPDGSTGRLSISPIPQEKYGEVPVLGVGVPMLAGTQVINDISDSMPNKRSRTVMLINQSSMVENTKFYKRYYESRGWRPMMVTVDPKVGSQALSYQKKKQDANIVVLQQDGESHILFNEVKSVY